MRLSKRVRAIETVVVGAERDEKARQAEARRAEASAEWQRQFVHLILEDVEYAEEAGGRLVDISTKRLELLRQGRDLEPDELAAGERLAAELTERLHAAQPDRDTCTRLTMVIGPLDDE
jgi:hypothetical protein